MGCCLANQGPFGFRAGYFFEASTSQTGKTTSHLHMLPGFFVLILKEVTRKHRASALMWKRLPEEPSSVATGQKTFPLKKKKTITLGLKLSVLEESTAM